MPVFKMKCPDCDHFTRRLAKCFGEVNLTCPNCGATMVRAASGPSTSVKEVLDNGLMPKRVERFRDAEEWMKDRAANADPLAGIAPRDEK
jgi:ribosomal protein S27E